MIVVTIWGGGQSHADAKNETKVSGEKVRTVDKSADNKELAILTEKVQSLDKRIDANLKTIEEMAIKTIEAQRTAIEADKRYADYLTAGVALVVGVLTIVGAVLAFFGIKEFREIKNAKQRAENIVGDLDTLQKQADRNKINVRALVAVTRVMSRIWQSDRAGDEGDTAKQKSKANEAYIELQEAERLGQIRSASLLLEKGKALKRLGKYAQALVAAEDAKKLAKEEDNLFDEARAYYNCACYLALLNDRDASLKELVKAISLSPVFRIFAKERDPDLVSLNGDPRFEQLINEEPRSTS